MLAEFSTWTRHCFSRCLGIHVLASVCPSVCLSLLVFVSALCDSFGTRRDCISIGAIYGYAAAIFSHLFRSRRRQFRRPLIIIVQRTTTMTIPCFSPIDLFPSRFALPNVIRQILLRIHFSPFSSSVHRSQLQESDGHNELVIMCLSASVFLSKCLCLTVCLFVCLCLSLLLLLYMHLSHCPFLSPVSPLLFPSVYLFLNSFVSHSTPFDRLLNQ